MRYSKMFTKTNKDSKEYDSKNATFLIKGGFIHQTMSGVYTFLPLGLRVLNKIEDIVREEMNELGEELLLPALSPTDLWETTERIENVDVLFKVEGANDLSKQKNGSEYILNSTQEEVITPIAKQFNFSYKDLPKAVYQIQSKFRNEARPKSGILRGREFRMKDLYSFHTSEEDLRKFYKKAEEAYKKVYDRLGIGHITYVALASGGDFTKDFSHEFQTKCETGEDLIFHAKKTGVYYNKEVAPSMVPNAIESTDEELTLKKVETIGMKTVEDLIEYLQIPIEQATKTILFEADNRVVAVALRGDYEVNEIKLKKVLDCTTLKLASQETVKRVTGAEIGYAGLIGLPEDVIVVVDDSLKGRRNLECGGNETDTHYINVNFGRDIKEPEKYVDIKEAKEGDLHPETKETYEVFKASEVGNIFPLNTKFTKAFGYKYTDENGDNKLAYMGSYGIGTTRVMGILAEVFNDENGLMWPKNVAPYMVHIVGLNMEDESVVKKCEDLYKELKENNVEVLFDDRPDTKAGEKFADADLIGCPIRVVVSKKTNDKYEVKLRSEEQSQMLGFEELLERCSKK